MVHKIRSEFEIWLSSGNAKKNQPDFILKNLSDVSDYALSKNISKVSLFEILSLREFNFIRTKLLGNKMFRITQKKTYRAFERFSKLYADFLKQFKTEIKQSENKVEMAVAKVEINDKVVGNSDIDHIIADKSEVLQEETIDWGKNLIFAKTKPRKMIFRGIATSPQAWNFLLMDVCNALMRCIPYIDILGFTWDGTSKILFQREWNGENWHKKINRGFWVDTNFSADNIVKIIRKLFDYYKVDINNLEITIVRSTSINADETKRYCSDIEEKVINVIATRFINGFRKSSKIDFERFKNFFADEYDEPFQYDTEWLNSLLETEALIYDERAYIYDKNVVNSVRLYLEQIGSPCIYIDAFFNKYLNELYIHNIFSRDMLRAFIEKNYHGISIKWDYILLKDNISPSDLIKEIFSERETWSFDELQERLPYLKMDTIRQAMNGPDYFRVDKGTYIHIDNMDLPNSEGEKIAKFVEDKLRLRDYVTANELDLSMFENLNSHCSFAAVRDAVFYKFLSDKYEKTGQVITKIGNKLRVLDIIEQYCHEAEMVSFEELNAFEATFDPKGNSHSQCLIAGHNTMIRVSAELFVSDSNIDFDVTRIDEAIKLYCTGNFIPIRKVTDFSLFPFAGYPWNLFLLESYVRRFSRVFKYDVRAVNSANIGAIVRKSFAYNNYDDILALALAKSPINLNDKKAIGNYLFNNGYIGWRNLGKSESKIIKGAKILREGGAA
ncbi:MAG: hypothetical protein WDK95_15360 [Syntrophorhabdaceae bacterium]